MVDGVGNGRESLEAGRSKGLERRSCRGVGDGILGNGEFLSVLRGQCNRILRTNEVGLIGIVGDTQVRALGSYVAGGDEPVLAQVALHGQVPLLGRCRNPVERHRQATEGVDVARKYWRLGRVGCWITLAVDKALKEGRSWHKVGAHHAWTRDQCRAAAILVYKKEAGQTSSRQHGGNADN